MDSFLECGRDAGNAGLVQGGENNGVQVCRQIWASVDTTIWVDNMAFALQKHKKNN
jgi:hypothetical protein